MLPALQFDRSANFYALLRDLEHQRGGLPRFGEALRPKDEMVRFGQKPSLNFALHDVHGMQLDEQTGQLKFYIQNFGLFGPNGALPLHLTEYAYARIHHHGDESFNEFLDVFHHRAYLLFYRAWARSKPHVDLQSTGQPNLFTRCLSAMVGHGAEWAWGREALPDAFRLAQAHHFCGARRHTEGLKRSVQTLINALALVHEFQGQWLTIQSTDLTRLGGSSAGSRLGYGAIAGKRVWSVQSALCLELGPLSLSQYRSLLRGEMLQRKLTDLVNAYVGLELDWRVRLCLRADQVPITLLGRKTSRLGRDTWLGRWKPLHPAEGRFNFSNSKSS